MALSRDTLHTSLTFIWLLSDIFILTWATVIVGVFATKLRPAKTNSPKEQPQCLRVLINDKISSNNDLYGIGIFVTALANLRSAWSASSIASTSNLVNLWFLLALLVFGWVNMSNIMEDQGQLDANFLIPLGTCFTAVTLLGTLRKRNRTVHTIKLLKAYHLIGISSASIACLQCLFLFLWNLVQTWKIMVQLKNIYKEGQIGRESLWKIYLDYLLLVPAAQIDKINFGSHGSTNTESPGEETESSTMRSRLETHLRQRYPSINSLVQNRSSTYNATESGSPPAEDQEITTQNRSSTYNATESGSPPAEDQEITTQNRSSTYNATESGSPPAEDQEITTQNRSSTYNATESGSPPAEITNSPVAILGVERALLWYKPDGVNNLSSAGQLIALLMYEDQRSHAFKQQSLDERQ
ncbi:hypothetical protein BDZ91DRAFT_765185 [Kalaharituber pfeilii]|nr:hypothetical protein BDZ91DRAFT_765185 [Kalaharituber pfeilii]